METKGAEIAREGNSFSKFDSEIRKRRVGEGEKISERSSVMPSATSPHPYPTATALQGRGRLTCVRRLRTWTEIQEKYKGNGQKYKGHEQKYKGNRNTRERGNHSRISVRQKARGDEDKITRTGLALE